LIVDDERGKAFSAVIDREDVRDIDAHAVGDGKSLDEPAFSAREAPSLVESRSRLLIRRRSS
jgi:hypothetical protein